MHALAHNREHGLYFPVSSLWRSIRRSSTLYTSMPQHPGAQLGCHIHKHGKIIPNLANEPRIYARDGPSSLVRPIVAGTFWPNVESSFPVLE